MSRNPLSRVRQRSTCGIFHFCTLPILGEQKMARDRGSEGEDGEREERIEEREEGKVENIPQEPKGRTGSMKTNSLKALPYLLI